MSTRYAEKLGLKLWRRGCHNRPFYHIVIVPKKRNMPAEPMETIGTYDPLPNQNGENYVSVDMSRLRYWLGRGALVSQGVGALMGLMGVLPIPPECYIQAWRVRESNQKSGPITLQKRQMKTEEE